jgi:predicted DNA-binding transcriptional regulator YafY
MDKVDRVERLTNLLLVLLDARQAITLREIAETVPGYPTGADARRQAFERDKRTLREEGVVVTVEPGADGTAGYRVRPEDYYLPDLGLAPDEQVALNLAVAGVHLDDRSGRGALLKLGFVDDTPPPLVASLPASPYLARLHEAIVSRSTVEFPYRGVKRRVDPHRLRFRGGFWYLVGQDNDREEVRTYRVDRMEALPSLGDPGAFEAPPREDGRQDLLGVPWRFGEGEPVTSYVSVDALMAPRVRAELGEDAVVESRPDESVVVRLEVTNDSAFRSWVLGLLDHAEVLGPPSTREMMRSWLVSMSGHISRDPSGAISRDTTGSLSPDSGGSP